jgi:hypothetical protein
VPNAEELLCIDFPSRQSPQLEQGLPPAEGYADRSASVALSGRARAGFHPFLGLADFVGSWFRASS